MNKGEKDAGELGALEGYLRSLIKVKEITPKKKYALEFPMYRIPNPFYHCIDDHKMYKFFLVREKDGRFYLRDDGAAYKELDFMFDLEDEDVIKDLNIIMQEYGCEKIGNNVAIECPSPEDIHIKLSNLVQAISVMLSMKLFYVYQKDLRCYQKNPNVDVMV